MAQDMRSYKIPTLFGSLLAILLFFSGAPQAFASPTDPDTESSSGSAIRVEDLRVPAYKKDRPQWGVEVTASLNAFGGNALTVPQGTKPIYAFSFLGEYQPPVFQSFGVLGLGPSVNVYPAFGTDLTYGFLALSGVGGQIRYQARYFREQPIVPVFAYSTEYFSYKFRDGSAGHFFTSGPTVGLWILLNFLESSSAAQLYINSGVSRSYLALEYRNVSGQDSNISVNGGSYYFGFRVEF